MFERGMAKRDPTRVAVHILQHMGALHFKHGENDAALDRFKTAWEVCMCGGGRDV